MISVTAILSMFSSKGAIGHSLSGSLRNSGPFHHTGFDLISSTRMPRDGRSAGFIIPGQWFHDSLSVRFRISLTRWLPGFLISYPAENGG